MFWSLILNLLLVLSVVARPLPAKLAVQGNILSLKPNHSLLEIKAKRGALFDPADHLFIFQQNADQVQPIASISKLMTALVFLRNNPGWDQIYQITASDNVPGGLVHLFLGERVKVRDLFYTSLVASDNGATMALVHATGLSEKEFVKQMNQTARQLGLLSTHFLEPTGLSDGNVSTAHDVALLAQAAFSYPEIRQATTMSKYDFQTLGGRDKQIISTDYLLDKSASSSVKVLAGKTGFTDPAGYCFVGLLQGASTSSQPLIVVVLNSDGKNERFLQSKQIFNWALDSYNLSQLGSFTSSYLKKF